MSEPGAGGAAPRPWWVPLQFLAAIALLQWLPAAGWTLLGAAGLPPATSGALDRDAWGMAVFGVACLGIVAFALLTPAAVPWRPVRLPAVLRVYLPAAAVWFLLMAGYLYLMRASGQPVAMQPGLGTVISLGARDLRIVPFVLTVVVLAPLAEEIVFRGYLLGTLQLVLARGPALGLSAVAFGLVHGLPYALPITLLGLVFGWLRQRHGSLWPSVCAHVLHNALTMAIALWAPAVFTWLYPT